MFISVLTKVFAKKIARNFSGGKNLYGGIFT